MGVQEVGRTPVTRRRATAEERPRRRDAGVRRRPAAVFESAAESAAEAEAELRLIELGQDQSLRLGQGQGEGLGVRPRQSHI